MMLDANPVRQLLAAVILLLWCVPRLLTQILEIDYDCRRKTLLANGGTRTYAFTDDMTIAATKPFRHLSAMLKDVITKIKK